MTTDHKKKIVDLFVELGYDVPQVIEPRPESPADVIHQVGEDQWERTRTTTFTIIEKQVIGPK